MPDPPSFPDAGDRGVAPGPAATKPVRRRRMRMFRTIAIVLVLLFIAAQVAGGGRPSAGGRTASRAPTQSHLDEARGHLNAILHLFD
jgi:hypothetical protein